jgi:hypothetical protein
VVTAVCNRNFDSTQALNPRRSGKDDIAQMTPEEEVLLLHVME